MAGPVTRILLLTRMQRKTATAKPRVRRSRRSPAISAAKARVRLKIATPINPSR